MYVLLTLRGSVQGKLKFTLRSVSISYIVYSICSLYRKGVVPMSCIVIDQCWTRLARRSVSMWCERESEHVFVRRRLQQCSDDVISIDVSVVLLL